MPFEDRNSGNFSLNQLSEEADQAWNNIRPWVQKQVERATPSFHLDPQQIDEITSRVVAGIRKKAKSELTPFDDHKKLSAYIRVAARRLALRAVKKAQRFVELATAENFGNPEVLSTSEDKSSAENNRSENDEILRRVEERVARHRPARDFTILNLVRDGASGDEMARALGVKRNAAYQAKHRLMKILRALNGKLE